MRDYINMNILQGLSILKEKNRLYNKLIFNGKMPLVNNF